MPVRETTARLWFDTEQQVVHAVLYRKIMMI